MNGDREVVVRMRRWIDSQAAALALIAVLAFGAGPASADTYEPESAGNPLRVVAYVLHPVGVLLDVLIFRPAHWLGSQPVISQLIGHEKDHPES